jgi:hypothetical protein
MMDKQGKRTAIGCLSGVVLLGVLLGMGGCLKNGCGPHYSDGQRMGELRKFSRKGFFVKSYEGELLLSDNKMGKPDIWTFSVKDPQVARQLQEVPPGTKVIVEYYQYLFKPMGQDSDYTVIGVRK